MAGYMEIKSNATTVVKSGGGVLEAVVVNNAGSAWTLQIFDNVAGSGTAIAGGTAFTITGPGYLPYNCNFCTGLTVVTAGTTPGSITVVYA